MLVVLALMTATAYNQPKYYPVPPPVHVQPDGWGNGPPYDVYGPHDLPPPKYDRWPSEPVLFFNLSWPELQFQCSDAKKNAPNRTALGCETQIKRDNTLLGLMVNLRESGDRYRLYKFVEHMEVGQSGCVVFLPMEGQLTHRAMNHDYRHELGHCNGWKHN